MANNKARVNDSGGGTVSSLQTIRIPFYAPLEIRNTGAQLNFSGNTLNTNVYLENIKEKNTGGSIFRAIKRQGINQYNTHNITYTECYGIYYKNNYIYVATDTGLYALNLATNLATLIASNIAPTNIPKKVAFTETHPDSATPYVVMNDGTTLFCIDATNTVTILNNVAINTSSVAAASVITTATNHKLITGNKVIIRGHAGSTPNINDVAYVVTVLSPTTFSIPVNVTVAGAGGTLGVFPANIIDIEFLDGYLFVGTVNGRIYNCDYNDALQWRTSSYITCQMQNDSLIGLGRQNNFILGFKGKTTQFFYDAGNNIIGQTPLANSEQAMQQIGCAAGLSIASTANTAYWIGNAKTGGYTVYKLNGTSDLKDIGTGPISRLIQAETVLGAANINSCVGNLITINGYTFYTIVLFSQSLVAVYNENNETWTLWSPAAGGLTNYGFWPIHYTQSTYPSTANDKLFCWYYSGSLLYSHYLENQGNDYRNESPTNITVELYTNAITLDTNKRKFWERVELVGDNWGTSGVIGIAYSNVDVSSFTGSRLFNMTTNKIDQRWWARALGNGRRRSWYVTDQSNGVGTRYEALECDVRISEY